MSHEERQPVEHRLRFIASPLLPKEERSDSDLSLTSTAQDKENGVKHEISQDSKGSRTEHLPWKHHQEATPIELFFDLFFVANLNAFTTYHDVNTKTSLADYIGFFSILWITWFHASLYDVRFSWDSVIDRACKAFHLGIMISFSVIGASFYPSDNDVDGRPLALLLMGSRIFLFMQYTISTIQLWQFPKTRVAMIMSAALYLITGLIFLGLSFAYPPRSSNAYIGFYVVSGMEVVLHFIIAATCRSISLKGTHVRERMGLLTLIVLGEGIITLAKSCITVWKNKADPSALSDYPALVFTSQDAGNIGGLVTGVLLLYFMYQLYFDTVATTHFGTIKQHLWAIAHFPIHITLVLFGLGSADFLLFHEANGAQNDILRTFVKVDLVNRVFTQSQVSFAALSESMNVINSTEYFEQAARDVNSTAQQISEFFKTAPVDFEAVENIANGAELGIQDLAAQVYRLITDQVAAVYEKYELTTPIPPADPNLPEADAIADELFSYFKFFDLTLVYFFVSAGLAVLFIGSIWWYSKTTEHTRFDIVRFVVWMASGLTLCLLSLLEISASKLKSPGIDFMYSAWVLPTVVLILFFLITVFHLPFGRHGAIVAGHY